MSRFLFTVLPTNDFGLLTRSLPIARELKLKGHETAFCHPAKGPRILIAEEGFKNLLPDDPLYYFIADSSMGGIFRLLGKGRPLRTLKIVYDFFKPHSNDLDFTLNSNPDFIRANVDAFTAMIDLFKPDAIVDFINPWACIAARVLKKPLISVIQWQLHPQSPGLFWWRDPPENPKDSVQVLNEVLRQYCLPTVGNSVEIMMGNLVLVVGIPEMDPISKEADVTYIGPVLWQSPKAASPKWIDKLETGKPVVWVYTGRLRYAGRVRTPLDSEIVLQASIEALAKEDVQVILSTGHQDLPRAYSPLPDNFRFEPFVPGLTMAAKSDLMIHHGGYGSCQTGLFSGTPAVIIPTLSERESNARRVVEQGAAEMVLPKCDTSGKIKDVNPEELAAKVRKVLSTPSYKENALRISARLKEYGGAPQAARLIEECVSKKR